MSVLCLRVCRLYVPNIMNFGIFLHCTSSKLARLLDIASNFALVLMSGLEDKKMIKANRHEK